MAHAMDSSGNWSQVSVDQNPTTSTDPTGTGTGTDADGTASGDYGNRIAEPTDVTQTGANKSAQDKYDEVQQSICEGTLKPVVAIPKMPSRVSINIFGVGNVLGGKYYVRSVKCSIKKSGIDQTIEVRKTEFGGTLRMTDDSRDGRPSALIR